MPMKVEAAVVTQKKQNVPFNTDSVNINGKVLPHEVIQNGYKGTGVMNGTVFFSISSSAIEGFADASVAAFNERAESFKSPDSDPSEVITGYFKDSVYALGEMGHRSSELASSILFAGNGQLILAKTGDTQLYAYSKNGFAKVTPALFANEDNASQYGLCTFPTVAPEDIFLLVSPGVSQVLTDKDLDDICKVAEGSVKKIVTLIAKVVSAKEGTGGISAIAIKVIESDNAHADAPVFGFANSAKNGTDPSSAGPGVVASGHNDGRLYSSDEAAKRKTKRLTVAVLAAVVVLVLLACAALALKIFGKSLGSLFGKEPETTTAVETTTERPSETTTRAPVTTTNPVTTTMPVTTTVPVTTTAPATTRSSSSTSSRSTTQASYVDYDDDDDDEEEEEGTTAEPETTSPAPTEPSTIPSELAPIETDAPSETPSGTVEPGSGFFD